MKKYNFLRIVAVIAAIMIGTELMALESMAWLVLIPALCLAETLITVFQFKELGYIQSNSGPKRRDEARFFIKMKWLVFLASIVLVSVVYYFY